MRPTKAREDRGFTLIYAVILSVVFAGLLAAVFYFLKINSNESARGIYKLQTIYLAESGNNRGLARMNVMSLPELDLEDMDLDDEDMEEGFFDEDDDFWDEDWDEAEDDDVFGDEDDPEDYADEEEKYFLAKIPRYINFYHKNPFFVNVDTGQIITEAQYYAMVQEQQNRIQTNRQLGLSPEETPQEILVEEVYFPLPEVNVAKIGTIPVKKGIHLKPGFKVKLADNVPIKLKQRSIVEEYLNYVPPIEVERPRVIVRAINPNFVYPGDYVDIRVDGDNLEGIFPQFSTAEVSILEAKAGYISIGVNEKAVSGRYQLKIGPAKAEFYIVPIETQAPAPNISDITLAKPRDGNPQFIKMTNKEKLENVRITGINLSNGKDAPVIVPDSRGIVVEIISFKADEIICNIITDKPEIGSHYISIFTDGGQSNSWIFNVEKIVETDPPDPYTGTYSTLLTLLEVKSLPNLPLKSVIEGTPTGRPETSGAGTGASGSGTPAGTQGGGRPGSDRDGQKSKKNFDLLRSDLDTVWKLETVATVNNISYKETRIIRRSEPRAEAAIITNTSVSFGQSSIKVEGMLEALTRLVEPASGGDTEVTVEGVDPDQDRFTSREDEQANSTILTGNAVVEDLGFGIKDQSPASRGFKPGGIVAITSTSRSNSFTDFAFVESTGPNTIKVRDPGFQENHFQGDDVTQFVPAIITPEPIGERDARKNLDPPGAFIKLEGKTSFEYVFRTKLNKMSNWSNAKTISTKVPSELIRDYDGYLGLAIVEGVPSYTGSNALYGQGTLIIDTTLGGRNPTGNTVTIGGSGKLPSIFDGLIYVIGNVQISGPTEIAGAIIVNSPSDRSIMRISGSGNISYSPNSVKKAILHIPFCEEPRTRILEKSSGQKELAGGEEN